MSRMSDPVSDVSGEQGQGGGSTEQLKQSAQQVGQDLKNLGTQARDAAGQAYGQVRDQAGEYYEQGKQKITEYQGELESYIREQPVKSLLIAAGVGLVLGILWKRS